jgi:hypothetical protein
MVDYSDMMRALIDAMSLVLMTWLGLFLVFIGLGLCVRRFFGLKALNSDSLLTSFWIGWTTVVFILQIWHLQFRIDWRAFTIIALIGVVGLIWNRRELLNLVGGRPAFRWLFILVFSFVEVWLANRAIGPPVVFDSGFYYLGSMRWAATYPIVPGLGHIHPCFAYNSSYFLYVAMMEIGPWAYKSHHIANGLLLSVLFAQILISGFKLIVDRKGQVQDFFFILLLAPFLRECLKPFISSPTPDLAVFVFGIVLSARFLALLDNLRQGSDSVARYNLFTLSILATVGLTIKLSFAAMGAAVLLLSCVSYITEARRDRKKTIILALLGASALLIPWLIRGVVLSGWLVYPSLIASFPVEWRIPEHSVRGIATWVRSWARKPYADPSEVLGNWNWLGPWMSLMAKRYFEIITPLALMCAGCLFSLFYRIRTSLKWQWRMSIWLFLIPPIVSLVFWFLLAPDLRYASAFFWILGAGAAALVANELRKSKGMVVSITAVVLAALLTLIPHYQTKYWFIPPGLNQGFHPTPRAHLKAFVTNSGLVIYVPQVGNQCWDAPLPCTPYPKKNLSLIKSEDLGGGFKLD